MTTIVMKFGGTSMGSADSMRTVGQILTDYRSDRPVAVVSAMSGVTDGLLEAADLARAGKRRKVEDWLLRLRDRHDGTAVDLLSGSVDRTSWEQQKRRLFDELHDLLLGATLLREVSARALDAIVGYGELLSAALLTAHLRARGIVAEFADARQFVVTDDVHGGATPLMKQLTTGRVRRSLLPVVEAGGIPVVTGYIGATRGGVPTTLGRGGSDFSASIIASALPADEIWIWGDVDGVMTADPRLEPQARLIQHLSFAEAAELAHFGAKVLHPRTMWPAIERGIPIRVRNTFNRGCAGTVVEAAAEAHPDVVKGITTIPGLALVTVEGSGMMGVPGVAARVFAAVARADANVYMISQGSSEHTICFVVRTDAAVAVREAVDGEFLRERAAEDVDRTAIHGPVAIVAIVGDGMKGTPGVAARIFTAIGLAGVNVLAIAQGSSERNISFVVDESDAAGAVRAVHREYVE